MLDANTDLNRAVFAKTALGQQEIQSRALGLSPLARRLLILMDGKRCGEDLVPLLGGHGMTDLLNQLMAKACIEMVKLVVAPAPILAKSVDVVGTGAIRGESAFDSLPEAQTRTPKELEMARNFMINTLNSEFGQHMCLTLIEAISASQTVQDLRSQYAAWFKTMNSSRGGAKELPGLNQKLFRVL